ncbi:ABC transporter ATP-binding protein [Ktedonospora formicarum]|uniref:ABC transporter ATP-binding protein n=1 Tax=Ktedonospora formicarum TaxID=2778364 RepID=A0A8J3MUZ2_9CHLR|nr:ABC transporter ATP-binding protein [Ktedonospora formicarum]GHO47083.1 ABC transporter ATP-binding protein [Ktedonospora formicarum]
MHSYTQQNPLSPPAMNVQTGAPSSQGASSLLQMQDLTKTYSNTRNKVTTHALNGIHLDVYPQEFISIMGPSGSGKTTLLNILAGLDQPTSGEFWLQGENLASLKADELALFRRRHLGFVFQDFNLLDTLTLAENVALPLSLDRQNDKHILQRVSEMMRFLGIEDQMQRYPYEVSGGQQQRTAVARAIIHQPRLLLADEPTGNLDSASARSLLELFQQLNSQRRATILMVTHDPFSASYSQRVIFIKDGRIFMHLRRTGSQQHFFQSILNTLAQVEGTHELA